MISVAEAHDHIAALASPLGTETIPLRAAHGRMLRDPIVATRDQPPFAASVMDGYAVPAAEVSPDDSFYVVGEAAAGAAFDARLEAGQAVRIFTGAPVPEGAMRVIIQEDVTREGDRITLKGNADSKLYIRPSGADFKSGQEIPAPRRLSSADIALAAAMNAATLRVSRRPVVALLATGDELVMPGEAPRADQIIASNTFGLAALVESEGSIARILPIAPDREDALEQSFTLAASADLIVTIGGASVGDHDLVGKVAAKLGMDRSFYRIAMRPGKPLMAGRLGETPMVGLPGNPVSSMVCGHIFLRPLLRAMQGAPFTPLKPVTRRLTAPLDTNGPREHYMRAENDGETVRVKQRQDSALLTVLAEANALVVRPPNDPARNIGESVQVLLL